MTGWELLVHLLIDRQPREPPDRQGDGHQEESAGDHPRSSPQQPVGAAHDRQRPGGGGANEGLRGRRPIEQLDQLGNGQPVDDVDHDHTDRRRDPERPDRSHVGGHQRRKTRGRRQAGHEAWPGEDGECLAVGGGVVAPGLSPPPVLLLMMQRLSDPDDEHQRQHLAVHDGEGLTERRHEPQDDGHRERHTAKTGHDVGPAPEVDEENHQHHRHQEGDAVQHAGQNFVGVGLLDLGIPRHLGGDSGLLRPAADDATEARDSGPPAGEVLVGDVDRGRDGQASVAVAHDETPRCRCAQEIGNQGARGA